MDRLESCQAQKGAGKYECLEEMNGRKTRKEITEKGEKVMNYDIDLARYVAMCLLSDPAVFTTMQ